MMEQSKLRVAIVSDALAERNGVGTYYVDLAEHLRDCVEEVVLICPSMTEKPDHQAFTLPLPGDTSQCIGVPNPRRLWHALKSARPDVIIVPIPGPYGYMALLMARMMGVPTCIGFHTDYRRVVQTYWNPLLAFPAMGLLCLAHRLFFALGRTAITLNAEMLHDGRRAGAKSIRLVGTPIQKRFLEAAEPPPKGIEKLIALGRLAPEKNLPAYLRAAEAYPALHFRVAGDGPQRKLVEDCARRLSNLEYLGWLQRERVREILDASDVLVLPSLVEGFGTVIVEAMARRRLVIASSQCNIDDWKAVTESVCRIKPGQGVEDAIAELMSEDGEALALRAEKGREAALAMNERALRDWMEVFAMLAPEKSTGAGDALKVA